MSKLVAFVYGNETGAKNLEAGLIKARDEKNLRIGDAAIVIRHSDGRSQFSHASELVDRGSMGGIFWGFILALIFWTRWWGLSVGGALGDLRLDEDFVKDVGEAVGKGHSALLAIMEESRLPGVLEVAEDSNPTVYQSTLSEEDEQVLKIVFQSTREM